jgi:hypothetical protein
MTQFVRQQPETRRVTVETCRTILQQPNLTHGEASRLIEHLYLFANVVTDVLIEQRCHTRKTQDCVAEPDGEPAPASTSLDEQSRNRSSVVS